MDDVLYEIARMIEARDALAARGVDVPSPVSVAETISQIARLPELTTLADASLALDAHLGGSGTVEAAAARTEFRAAVERYRYPLIQVNTFV